MCPLRHTRREVMTLAKAGMRRPEPSTGDQKIKQAKLRNEKALKEPEKKSGSGENRTKPL